MHSKKKQDLNLIAFNMITGINESKTLTEHFSCECKCTCKFDGTKYKWNQWWNNVKCWYEYKNINMWKRLCLESCCK